MATWEDGPEYAPHERPDAFVAPATDPLTTPEPTRFLSDGAPVQVPDLFTEPSDPVRPLAELVPALPGPVRDPLTPFAVQTSVLTDGSAWGSAHSSTGVRTTANQPDLVGTAGFPPPTGPAVVAPQAAPVPVTFASLTRALTWGVIITLLLAGVIRTFSPMLLAVAFGMTSLVHYRQRSYRRLVGTGLGLAVAVGLVAALTEGDLASAWAAASTVSLVSAWVVLVVGLVWQYQGMTQGEAPDRRPVP